MRNDEQHNAEPDAFDLRVAKTRCEHDRPYDRPCADCEHGRWTDSHPYARFRTKPAVAAEEEAIPYYIPQRDAERVGLVRLLASLAQTTEER